MKLSNGFEIQKVILDKKQVTKLKCPNCGQWGFIDADQFNGRVSIDCPECDFHETSNLAKSQINKHLRN